MLQLHTADQLAAEEETQNTITATGQQEYN